MSRRSSKTEKTFELLIAGRPPRPIKEHQLRAQFASLREATRWRDIFILAQQIGEKRRSTSWINNYFLTALEATGQHQALLSESQLCLETLPRDAATLSWNAHALRLNGRVDESVEILRRAIKQAKPDAALFNSLGSALKETGSFEEALGWFERAIRMQPSLAKAHWNRSDLVEDHQSAIETINKALPGNNSKLLDEHLFHFSLYRHFEKMEDFDSAFKHLQLANRLKRSKIEYSSDQGTELTNRIIEFFDSTFEYESASEDKPKPKNIQPIFIFGLPRSGTTLVEQILASHSEVHGGNELTFLNDAGAKVQAQHRIEGEFPNWMLNLPDNGWNQIGRNYQDLTQSLKFPEPRVTDKSLMNYRAAGLIAKSLPRAKMVHVVRDPMDVAFGCYKQVFGSGHLFSYDFEEIAEMIADHQKLVAHWQQYLPKRQYLVLDYQELVQEPSAQIAKLLAFCELDDEPECYTPENTNRTVRTLSATQVRQPINLSGLGGWKRYESELEPLRDALKSRALI